MHGPATIAYVHICLAIAALNTSFTVPHQWLVIPRHICGSVFVQQAVLVDGPYNFRRHFSIASSFHEIVSTVTVGKIMQERASVYSLITNNG